MSLAGFEPAIPVSEEPQILVLEGSAIGIVGIGTSYHPEHG